MTSMLILLPMKNINPNHEFKNGCKFNSLYPDE